MAFAVEDSPIRMDRKPEAAETICNDTVGDELIFAMYPLSLALSLRYSIWSTDMLNHCTKASGINEESGGAFMIDVGAPCIRR